MVRLCRLCALTGGNVGAAWGSVQVLCELCYVGARCTMCGELM